MKIDTGIKESYNTYAKEHIEDFRWQLQEDASRALQSWPGRSIVVLLILASALTYFDQISKNNPLAFYTLFSYAAAVCLILLYPVLIFIFSTIEKYSSIVLDLVCASALFGFCLTIYLILNGEQSLLDQEINKQLLQGQVALVLAGASAFAFHTAFWFSLIRNIFFATAVSIGLYLSSREFYILNILPTIEGFFMGVMINWVFHDGIKSRFYLRSTDADTRQHLHNQLSKLVYPHQLERIKLGDELEETMPLKEGKAIINVFDVQRSSQIRHEKTNEFFMGVFQAFLQISMEGYEHNPLRSRAFRLKETGDGFISAIGYPFLPVDSRSLADSAVSTALAMFDAFNTEVEKFNYARPIKGAMGLAYNSVQGTFQSGGIRSYDLFGEALIQAAKYEELRKQPLLWNLIKEHAANAGLEHFNILIVQETVYNSLSPAYRDLFVEIDLNDQYLKSNNFQMMYDNDARYVYFHVLE